MSSEPFYRVLADLTLVTHVLFVVFVLLGAALSGSVLLTGRPRWALSPKFCAVHALAVAIVVIQSWLGLVCPLTRWEASLRAAAGQTPYDESFIEHWLQRLLYYQAEPWVFTLVYSLFGVLVACLWWLAWRQRH